MSTCHTGYLPNTFPIGAVKTYKSLSRIPKSYSPESFSVKHAHLLGVPHQLLSLYIIYIYPLWKSLLLGLKSACFTFYAKIPQIFTWFAFPQHSRPPNFHGTGTPGPTYSRRQHPRYQISCVGTPSPGFMPYIHHAFLGVLNNRGKGFWIHHVYNGLEYLDCKKNTCYIWYMHTIQLYDTVIGATDTWILWLLTSGSVPMRAAKLWANFSFLSFKFSFLKHP